VSSWSANTSPQRHDDTPECRETVMAFESIPERTEWRKPSSAWQPTNAGWPILSLRPAWKSANVHPYICSVSQQGVRQHRRRGGRAARDCSNEARANFGTFRRSANSRTFGTHAMKNSLVFQSRRPTRGDKNGEFWNGESCFSKVFQKSKTPKPSCPSRGIQDGADEPLGHARFGELD